MITRCYAATEKHQGTPSEHEPLMRNGTRVLPSENFRHMASVETVPIAGEPKEFVWAVCKHCFAIVLVPAESATVGTAPAESTVPSGMTQVSKREMSGESSGIPSEAELRRLERALAETPWPPDGTAPERALPKPPDGWRFEEDCITDDAFQLSLADADTLCIEDGCAHLCDIPFAAIEALTGRRLGPYAREAATRPPDGMPGDTDAQKVARVSALLQRYTEYGVAHALVGDLRRALTGDESATSADGMPGEPDDDCYTLPKRRMDGGYWEYDHPFCGEDDDEYCRECGDARCEHEWAEERKRRAAEAAAPPTVPGEPPPGMELEQHADVVTLYRVKRKTDAFFVTAWGDRDDVLRRAWATHRHYQSPAAICAAPPTVPGEAAQARREGGNQ